ncbi:hypothetical protein D3C72_2490160 [compost metagenome]
MAVSVSGRRMNIHRPTTMAETAMKTKIQCQWPMNMITWPVPGAMTGMTMKTIMISDITSAICRPP